MKTNLRKEQEKLAVLLEISDTPKKNSDIIKGAESRIVMDEAYDNTLCSEYGFERIDVAEVSKTMSIGKKGHKKSRAVEVAYVNYDTRECR